MKIHQINPLGEIIDTVELTECFKNGSNKFLIEIKDKKYFLSERGIEEISVDLEKIQTNFMDNL